MLAQQDEKDDALSNSISGERILLIGPVLPYRGGIAQNTTMLYRILRVSKVLDLTIRMH